VIRVSSDDAPHLGGEGRVNGTKERGNESSEAVGMVGRMTDTRVSPRSNPSARAESGQLGQDIS
jgi:hypothetical protein